MARDLTEFSAGVADAGSDGHNKRITQRTGRSFAAAVSVLLLSTLVVNRSSATLSGDAAGSSAALEAGTIELTDDDEGRSLFDLSDLTPTRPVERCINIVYTGSILPVSLAVHGEAAGPLVEYTDVTIESGEGGDFGSCVGFTPSGMAYDGSVAGLANADLVDLGDIVNSGERRSFRIKLTLQDRQEALGQRMTMDFSWEVTPS